jgi:hypothetical protein
LVIRRMLSCSNFVVWPAMAILLSFGGECWLPVSGCQISRSKINMLGDFVDGVTCQKQDELPGSLSLQPILSFYRA